MTAVLPAGLLAVALGLSGVVAYQLVAPVAPIPQPPAQAASAAPVVVPPAYVPPPSEQFAIINDRPLFDPARRPVAEPPESGAAAQAPPELALVGVALGGGNSVALLKRPGPGPALSLHLGQSVDGWEVARIDRDAVVLRAGAATFTVKMRAATGLPQPPPAPLNHGAAPETTEKPDP